MDSTNQKLGENAANLKSKLLTANCYFSDESIKLVDEYREYLSKEYRDELMTNLENMTGKAQRLYSIFDMEDITSKNIEEINLVDELKLFTQASEGMHHESKYLDYQTKIINKFSSEIGNYRSSDCFANNTSG